MKEKLIGLFKDEQGQGMTEYGLIIALISIAAIAVIVAIGPKITAYFQATSDALDN